MQSLILFLILYLLKPFGLDRYEQSTGLLLPVCLGYGLLTFIAITSYKKTVSSIAIRKGKWTIMDSLISGILMWLTMGLINFAYSAIIFHIDSQHLLRVFLCFIYWTVIIGALLTFISLLVNYNRYLKDELATMINKTTEEQQQIIVSIHDEAVRGEKLTIPINDFLYAESIKNDIIVWYNHDGKTDRRTFRMTMAQLLDLMPYENIFQCHRSFIVNVNNITNAQGNSNGYQLRLGNSTTIIPVSRSNVSKLKSFLA